jgi:two-component system, NarL family, response regulator DesR
MIRILVAEDMRILRETLVMMLSLEDDFDVVAAVSGGTEAVPAALAHRPDIAILDIDLPGVDGLSVAETLHQRLPACRVLVLTALRTTANLRRALAVHAAGFLLKDAPAEELVQAIRRIAAGGQAVDAELALAALRAAENPLSPREAEVLRRHAGGADPAEIAAGMFLSYGTVRNYLASAVTKLGARNRVDAARIAAEAGWM